MGRCIRWPLYQTLDERTPRAFVLKIHSILRLASLRRMFAARAHHGDKEMNNSLAQTICVVSLASVAFAVPSMSQEKKAGDSAHKIVHSADLKWTPVIKGCEIAVVEGNLDAEGQPFVGRFHCSDGAKTPPHWHPADENITVLRGVYFLGSLGEVTGSAPGG